MRLIEERLHDLRVGLHEIRIEVRHAGQRVDRLEAALTEMRMRIETVRGQAADAAERIDRRINAAILWLALGAGGLLLKFVAPKLGL